MRVKSASLKFVKLLGGVLLIAAICSGNAVESQAKNSPKTGAKSEIIGHWAAPDCANTQEALSFTRHFYLKSAPERLELARYAQRGSGADHLILAMDGITTTVMRQEDGVLRTGIPEDGSNPKAEWEQLALVNPLDYTNCPDIPAVIPKPMQRLLRYIDRIDEACALSGDASTTAPRNLTQDCARVIFKSLDDNNDRTLSLVELKLGLANAALLGALAQRHVLDADGIATATTQAKDVAALAADILRAQDKNGDGKLDYNEAVLLPEGVDLSPLKDAVSNIGALLPAFKLAAMTL